MVFKQKMLASDVILQTLFIKSSHISDEFDMVRSGEVKVFVTTFLLNTDKHSTAFTNRII